MALVSGFSFGLNFSVVTTYKIFLLFFECVAILLFFGWVIGLTMGVIG